jgi:CheY-like chemotaxis protein
MMDSYDQESLTTAMKRVSSNRLKSPHDHNTEEPSQLVLYVEDDEDNRQVASFRLEKKYKLVFATTDREACESFIKYGSELSLILMDIELRGSSLNGLDLTRLIRGHLDSSKIPPFAAAVPRLETPVIFVTAYGQLYRRSELLAAGADEIIQKPVDFVELHTAMARAYLRRP